MEYRPMPTYVWILVVAVLYLVYFVLENAGCLAGVSAERSVLWIY